MNGTVCVLFKTRLIFPRINGPNIGLAGHLVFTSHDRLQAIKTQPLSFSKQTSFCAKEGITQGALNLRARNLCVIFINN